MAAGGRRPDGQACSALGVTSCDAELDAAAADDSPPAATRAAIAPPPLPPPLPPELPPAFSHRVPHFQQVHNWDCGLACVLMILRALGMRQHNMATLQRLCSTQSIWTIDLAYLLAACGARVQMLTVTIGANQAYSGERFYAEHMPSDSSRVESLFRAAPASGIPVHQRSLPLADLKALVLGGSCLPLVLVDKITLGSATAAQHSSWEAGQCAGAGVGRSSGDAAHGVAGPATAGGSGGGAAAAVAAGQDDVAPAGAAIPAAALEPGEAAPQPRQEAGQAASASPQRCGVPMPPAARITSPGQHAAAAAAAAAGPGPAAADEAAAGPGPAAADEAAAGPGPAAADEALPQQDAALFHASAADSCPGSPIGYLGHYVVLVGYDARSDEFEYRDPASERARLWVPAQRLEAARKCFGTDEDLLLVEVPGGSACCSSAGSSSSEGGAAADAATDAAGGTAQAGAAGGGRQGPPEAPPVLQQQQQQQPEDWGAAGASPRIVYG